MCVKDRGDFLTHGGFHIEARAVPTVATRGDVCHCMTCSSQNFQKDPIYLYKQVIKVSSVIISISKCVLDVHTLIFAVV